MSLRHPTVALMLLTFQYKPFMWCRSDVRLWHSCYLLFNISPLRDVAQTFNCGTLVIYFHYKPLSRCRLDVRLRHDLSFTFNISPLCGVALMPDCGMLIYFLPFEASLQTPDRSSVILLGFREDYRLTSFSFNMPCKFIIWVCTTKLLMCIMFAFVISYVQNCLASTFKVLTWLVDLARCWGSRSYGWRVR